MASSRTHQQATKDTRPKRAVIFTRARVVPYSHAQEYAQLRAQRLVGQAVAARLGAWVVATYETHGGTTEARVRAAVEQLLRQVEGGGIDFVIVSGFDRLARRPGELARIVRRLSAAGVRLVTTADPAGAFMEQVSLFCLVAKDNERRAA